VAKAELQNPNSVRADKRRKARLGDQLVVIPIDLLFSGRNASMMFIHFSIQSMKQAIIRKNGLSFDARCHGRRLPVLFVSTPYVVKLSVILPVNCQA
jgi:hypothetical protein